jgi:hypothetical protein
MQRYQWRSEPDTCVMTWDQTEHDIRPDRIFQFRCDRPCVKIQGEGHILKASVWERFFLASRCFRRCEKRVVAPFCATRELLGFDELCEALAVEAVAASHEDSLLGRSEEWSVAQGADEVLFAVADLARLSREHRLTGIRIRRGATGGGTRQNCTVWTTN